MSIEKLEEIKDKYNNTFNDESQTYRELHTLEFMFEAINTFKDQSDEIANLRQDLAKKEDVIEVNNIKIGGTD